MIGSITHVTLLVDEIDRALSFYSAILDFEIRVDVTHANGFRYVTIAPRGVRGPEVWLLPATTDLQHARVGNQTDDVMMVFTSDDCRADYARLDAAGVVFHGPPEEMAWGLEAIFEDLYGNRFALVEANIAEP